MTLRETEDFELSRDQVFNTFRVRRKCDNAFTEPFKDYVLLNKWLAMTLDDLNRNFKFLYFGNNNNPTSRRTAPENEGAIQST